MEFIQLPSIVQSADAACDRFAQSVRTIRAEITDTIALLPELVGNADILDTIETITLNTIWVATWAVTFAVAITFYAGQAVAEAWRTRNWASITAQICATPDADLDELVLPILSQPIAAGDFDIVELGADAEALATLTAHELRPLCQSRGIQWRNVRGQGKHLAKAEMIAALTC